MDATALQSESRGASPTEPSPSQPQEWNEGSYVLKLQAAPFLVFISWWIIYLF